MEKIEELKLTGTGFQTECLKRMGYKKEVMRCSSYKHYHYQVDRYSECTLIPFMTLRISDDNGFCDYYKKNVL